MFIDAILADNGPKYVAYVGGVGSGKTVVGVTAMVSQGVLYGGEYLIARQFMPELRDTTYKTFLELCPQELILDHKVQDRIVTIKSASGKPAIYYFRQLEEPDKLRSLNLSGFYIDEANQVSEEAFLMLQGRLRNPRGLRKGILTTNPKGHDWIYQYFYKKDMFKSDLAKSAYALIKAPSTENVHLPDGYVQSMYDTYSPERIKREIEGSFDAFEGQVYSEFRRDIHVIKPFRIPEHWPRIIGIDHGYRNPAAWIWGAVSPDGEIFIYREFYEREWLIEEILNGNPLENKVGVLNRMQGEKIEVAAIDPSVKIVDGSKKGESKLDEYQQHLPQTFPLIMANNSKQLGINRVKRYMKVDTKINRPMLFIFEDCYNLIEEIVKYRWEENNPSAVGKRAEKEEARKIDDHACDALRYLIMTRPEPYSVKEEEAQMLRKMTVSQRSLHNMLDRFKQKRTKGILDDV
jgi:PBSX family phage terminase large subunit